MTSERLERVLCVDDEQNILDGLRRNLHRHFEITTACGGAAGLKAIADEGPFAVIMSDIRMPKMDGIEFLSRAKVLAPDTARVLLTGNTDLTSAIAAVNQGNIFRFLSKPATTPDLVAALGAAVEQNRLVTAERVLLEETLLGCVKMMTEALALASPTAFGRAARVRERASRVAEHVGGVVRWKIEMAAMMSQAVGVALPPETLDRWQRGEELSPSENEMVARLPELSDRLLSQVPRMEEVRELLRQLHQPFQREGDPPPIGSRILRAVLDGDALESGGQTFDAAIDALMGRSGQYDPGVLLAMKVVGGSSDANGEIRTVHIHELQVGMILLDPILNKDGGLLLAHGNALTEGVIERLRNVSTSQRSPKPVRVVKLLSN